ncbi:MAG: phosphatidate cytidylyltransferase [Deltaproteobacteria bacterium]|nr:phosphatidate cytidylyltransferase [Deltaproteobacteria bacterium]
MKNFFSRLLTAFVAVPLLLSLLYLLPWSGWGSFVALALTVACLEFFALTHPDDKPARWVGAALTLGVYTALVITDFGARGPASWSLAALVLVAPVALIYTVFRPLAQQTAMLRMASMALAPMYLGTAFATNVALGRVGQEQSRHLGAGLVVFSLMVSWFGDTGGYFAGKGIGGPKLYPAVSPGKTWAGAFGGLAASALGAVIAHFWFLPELPLARGILAAILAGALGQIGDLCESLMKRSVNVKDSGAILPGHGGMLDRVDALLFTSVTLYGMQRMGWLIP